MSYFPIVYLPIQKGVGLVLVIHTEEGELMSIKHHYIY